MHRYTPRKRGKVNGIGDCRSFAASARNGPFPGENRINPQVNRRLALNRKRGIL
jgi:hypothetical protein